MHFSGDLSVPFGSKKTDCSIGAVFSFLLAGPASCIPGFCLCRRSDFAPTFDRLAGDNGCSGKGARNAGYHSHDCQCLLALTAHHPPFLPPRHFPGRHARKARRVATRHPEFSAPRANILIQTGPLVVGQKGSDDRVRAVERFEGHGLLRLAPGCVACIRDTPFLGQHVARPISPPSQSPRMSRGLASFRFTTCGTGIGLAEKTSG